MARFVIRDAHLFVLVNHSLPLFEARGDAFHAFVERSPLTYAAKVETPVLLLHGEEDNRCPIGQSEEYFVSLKRLGKEVEFVRFPGSSHSLVRSGHPKMREEFLTRTLAWFDRYRSEQMPISDR